MGPISSCTLLPSLSSTHEISQDPLVVAGIEAWQGSSWTVDLMLLFLPVLTISHAKFDDFISQEFVCVDYTNCHVQIQPLYLHMPDRVCDPTSVTSWCWLALTQAVRLSLTARIQAVPPQSAFAKAGEGRPFSGGLIEVDPHKGRPRPSGSRQPRRGQPCKGAAKATQIRAPSLRPAPPRTDEGYPISGGLAAAGSTKVWPTPPNPGRPRQGPTKASRSCAVSPPSAIARAV
ncbi:hypothetical protein KSP40_PGU011313 [Platanthera guangdongensis]|uniref:Uncharacterized protein n=1 Tax=Platanthera guangdongensis TaxID=2320717 RepID=A0ABR2MIX9_9ASPA